jgi:anti-anti-sigma regulatory factor
MTNLESTSVEKAFAGRDFALSVAGIGISADVFVSGRCTLGTAAAAMRSAFEALIESGAQCVVLELSAVTEFDHAGLSEVFHLVKELRGRGGLVVSVKPGGPAALLQLMEPNTDNDRLSAKRSPPHETGPRTGGSRIPAGKPILGPPG